MHELLFDFISKYITLNEDEKEAIKSLDIFRVVKKGTVLLKEGEVSREGYFVLKGCLRTYYVIGGEEKNTGFYTEMEGITPQCVRTNEPSEYYVSSMEDSIISVSTPEMEVEVFEKFPRFESLCRILSEELLAKEQLNFDIFRTQSPEQRYLSLTKNRPDLIQRIPQRHLASYLGITPESLSRLRARIQKKE
ncbi:Crp/Fnr family transcriptional regulator [Roseivirga sp.]|uniref:Crp/Fnr family transcriptional regulator n=1 Tax=Roseivirga sp. TaxID=1964215 RepID=UPI003B52D67B